MRLDPFECYVIKAARLLSVQHRRAIMRCSKRDESGRLFAVAVRSAAAALETSQLDEMAGGNVSMARSTVTLEKELSPEDLEICLTLHRLWWRARQRRAAEAQTGRA